MSHWSNRLPLFSLLCPFSPIPFSFYTGLPTGYPTIGTIAVPPAPYRATTAKIANISGERVEISNAEHRQTVVRRDSRFVDVRGSSDPRRFCRVMRFASANPPRSRERNWRCVRIISGEIMRGNGDLHRLLSSLEIFRDRTPINRRRHNRPAGKKPSHLRVIAR